MRERKRSARTQEKIKGALRVAKDPVLEVDYNLAKEGLIRYCVGMGGGLWIEQYTTPQLYNELKVESNHVQVESLNVGKKRKDFLCIYCGREFTSKQRLSEHRFKGCHNGPFIPNLTIPLQLPVYPNFRVAQDAVNLKKRREIQSLDLPSKSQKEIYEEQDLRFYPSARDKVVRQVCRLHTLLELQPPPRYSARHRKLNLAIVHDQPKIKHKTTINGNLVVANGNSQMLHMEEEREVRTRKLKRMKLSNKREGILQCLKNGIHQGTNKCKQVLPKNSLSLDGGNSRDNDFQDLQQTTKPLKAIDPYVEEEHNSNVLNWIRTSDTNSNAEVTNVGYNMEEGLERSVIVEALLDIHQSQAIPSSAWPKITKTQTIQPLDDLHCSSCTDKLNEINLERRQKLLQTQNEAEAHVNMTWKPPELPPEVQIPGSFHLLPFMLPNYDWEAVNIKGFQERLDEYRTCDIPIDWVTKIMCAYGKWAFIEVISSYKPHCLELHFRTKLHCLSFST